MRLFTGTGGVITYEGEFELDPERPFEERRAHSTHGGPDRRVFVFRLRPVGPSRRPGLEPAVVTVPIAEQNVESWRVTPGQYTKASATEAQLVRRFQRHLQSKGETVGRHRYSSSSGYLYNDLFNETRHQLVEAKGSVDRPAIRMAIGQLLDYASLESERPALGVLLPGPPADDVANLLIRLGITAIWPDGHGFTDTSDGRFV